MPLAAYARLLKTVWSYASAKPFPHMYFDGLFPVDVLDALDGEFPEPSAEISHHLFCKNATERGWRCIKDKGRGYSTDKERRERRERERRGERVRVCAHVWRGRVSVVGCSHTTWLQPRAPQGSLR